MKKIFNLLLLSCVALFAASCEKDDMGGTATQDMAGEWWVTVDVYDTNCEELLIEDAYGSIMVQTYNTAANIPTEMYLDDIGNFRNVKVVVDIDLDNLTFSLSDYVSTGTYGSTRTTNVWDGVITPDGATSITGMPADAISFWVNINISTNTEYGFDYTETNAYMYHIHGYRWTGFE